MDTIPPQVLGLIANMGLSLGRARAADRQRQALVTGATIIAATVAIEHCGNRHPAGSAVWNEVTETLGSVESALVVIERLARQERLGVSAEAEPYVREFAAGFIGQALSPAGTSLDTAAILAAIGLLRAQLPSVAPVVDPLASIPWHRRQGAPTFRVSIGMDGTRFLTTIELSGGDEPGDVRLGWTVDDGPEVFPLLMPEPGSKWKRQAKPAACQWPASEAHIAHLRLRFVTPDGEHGYHYHFPLERHEKGHWLLQRHLGSGLFDPEPF